MATKQSLILALGLLLAGCAETIAISKETSPAPGKTIVLGRVKVVSEGEPIRWLLPSFAIHILPDAGSELIRYGLTGDGLFLWQLPPGSYTITGFEWHRIGWVATRRRHIFARFTVLEDEAIVYTGILVIRIEGERYSMAIDDEYDPAVDRLKEEFPAIKGEIRRRLMQLREDR